MASAGAALLDSGKGAYLLLAVLLIQQAAVGKQTRARVDSSSSIPGILYTLVTSIFYQADSQRRHAQRT